MFLLKTGSNVLSIDPPIQTLKLVSVAAGMPILAIAFIGLSSAQAVAQSSSTAEQMIPNCLIGYPDGEFHGERAVTRYEFAAALNTCLNQRVQSLKFDDFATKSDVESSVQRQQQLNGQLDEQCDRLEAFENLHNVIPIFSNVFICSRQ
jgi:hypothetical protein